MHWKSLLFESALRIVEKFKGGKLWAPQKLKKKNHFFQVFGSQYLPSLKLFSDSEGTVLRQTFQIQKIIIWGQIETLGFLGFLKKNLKLKNAYLGSSKLEKLKIHGWILKGNEKFAL